MHAEGSADADGNHPTANNDDHHDADTGAHVGADAGADPVRAGHRVHVTLHAQLTSALQDLGLSWDIGISWSWRHYFPTAPSLSC